MAPTDHAEGHSHGNDHVNRHLAADINDIAHRQESGVENGERHQNGHEGPEQEPTLQASEIEGPSLCLPCVDAFL